MSTAETFDWSIFDIDKATRHELIRVLTLFNVDFTKGGLKSQYKEQVLALKSAKELEASSSKKRSSSTRTATKSSSSTRVSLTSSSNSNTHTQQSLVEPPASSSSQLSSKVEMSLKSPLRTVATSKTTTTTSKNDLEKEKDAVKKTQKTRAELKAETDRMLDALLMEDDIPSSIAPTTVSPVKIEEEESKTASPARKTRNSIKEMTPLKPALKPTSGSSLAKNKEASPVSRVRMIGSGYGIHDKMFSLGLI